MAHDLRERGGILMRLTALLIQCKAQQDTIVQCYGFTRSERDYLRGGLKHVPGIVGLAYPQAPPIPQVDDMDNRS
jgi:hypothetical protein